MTSRERLRKAIHHQQPDRPPRDLGSTLVTGIQAGAYARLKKALGIEAGKIRVYDPYQMLAEVEEPVKKALGVDTVGIQLPTTMFGYRNENWKPFRMFDGTDVEISGHFQYDVLPGGDIVQYPKGDRSVPPSGRMPQGGYYFDTIVREEPIDEFPAGSAGMGGADLFPVHRGGAALRRRHFPVLVRKLGVRTCRQLLGRRFRRYRNCPRTRSAPPEGHP